MPNFLHKQWDLLLGLAILWALIINILIITLVITDGNIIYSRDDTYIHMAIARNLALYGVWGINKNEFSSSSSSLLYTLLLAYCFFIYGVFDIIPFLVNCIFATLIIFFINKVLKDYYKIPKYANFLTFLAIIFFGALPGMIFVGMEHIVQTFINLCFVFFSSRLISKREIKEGKRFSDLELIVFFFAPLVTMIRYEGVFLILIVSFLLLIRKRIFLASIILILGFLPILIYGLISIYFGWNFFPNSIYVKSARPDLSTGEGMFNFIVFRIILELSDFYELLSILLGVFVVFSLNYLKERNIWKESNIMSLIFILLLFSHIQFGSIVHFRYYSYLISLGIFVLVVSINELFPLKKSLILIQSSLLNIKQEFSLKVLSKIGLIIVILLFIINSNNSKSMWITFKSPYASDNIYEQHYQMGLFIERYYKGKCVAVNDIGAVSYLSDAEILDLWGLADMEVGEARVHGYYNTEKIDEITKKHNCKIAILNGYFGRYGGLPDDWVRVGEWEVRDNLILGDSKVFFYAVDPNETEALMENLMDFSSSLPPNIIQGGNYTTF